jgi:hypothetical protein
MMIRFLLSFLLAPAMCWAQSLNFTNLTEEDFNNISKEMSGNFMHHSVQGAAPLGKIFGFELGLLAGQQPSPKIDEITKRSGGSGLSNLYHAGLLGVISVPFGITGEVTMIPKLSSNDADFQMTSLGLKIALNSELLTFLPFNLALRGISSDAKFSFRQISGATSINVENQTRVTGLQVLVSPSLPLIEPYAGFGLLSGKNTISASGGVIFDPSFSTSTSSDKTNSSTQMILGVNANLLLFRLGAEYSNAFGNNSVTAKMGFGF